MGIADLHIHSTHSDGTATVRAILHYAVTRTDLDVIAITDHDTLTGAWEAQEVAADYGIEVVPGMEITTAEGHLLALFINHPVKSGLSYVETLQQIHLYGGLAVAPHPTSIIASSVGRARIEHIVRHHPGYLTAIETDNASIFHQRDNQSAQMLRWQTALAGIGCSDAHIMSEIGGAATAFPGTTAHDLRQALEGGHVVPLPVRRRERYWQRNAARFLLRFGFGLVEDYDDAVNDWRMRREGTWRSP